MEGKIVISTACNNGSSSVISKDGELYMFGKDAIYSDSTSKLIFVFWVISHQELFDWVWKFLAYVIPEFLLIQSNMTEGQKEVILWCVKKYIAALVTSTQTKASSKEKKNKDMNLLY